MFTQPIPPQDTPLRIVKVSAALPAAGAWDTPLELTCPQHSRMTLFISYTRGAAGGAVDFQIQVSPYSATAAGVQNWFNQTEFSPAVLAAGVDSQARLQQEYVTYTSKAAAIENVVYGTIELGANIERFRVPTRESGVVGTPGTCHIVAHIYSEQ